jgi:ArsR family transcriptional regulator
MHEGAKLRAEARSEILKALAHPTRIYIVDLLDREGPRCVCELAEEIGVDMSTVSRHLSLLRGAGILQDEKKGTTVYYSLACDCISEFMKGLEKVLRSKHQRERERFRALVE